MPPPKSAAIKNVVGRIIHHADSPFCWGTWPIVRTVARAILNSAVIKSHMAMPNICGGYYNDVLCAATMDKYDTLIRDKVGVVIGSL
jgi:hypothetical protein